MTEPLTTAEKARRAGLDERTIALAYASFDPPSGDRDTRAKGKGRIELPHEILEAHARVCIYAMAYDNPVGNVRFPQFGAGVVREGLPDQGNER